jgi:hypothetical protein
MACTDRGLKPLSQTDPAQQRLDVRMQCLARTVPDEDSPLERADAQAALGARDRCRSTRHVERRETHRFLLL